MFKKKILLGACLAASILFAFPAVANPITVQSVLFDSDGNVLTVAPPAPTPANGDPLQDGNFTIFRISTADDLTVGNGVDDRTNGIFDFRSDPDYAAFSSLLAQPHGKITAAILSFVLTPFSLFTNDQFNLENGPFVGEPEIGNQLTDNPLLANQISKLVTINLLNYFSETQLENYLSNGSGDFANDGRILFTYSDDAIVTGAALRLTANIPEPGTLALLSLGLLASLTIQRRKNRRA